MHVGGDAIPLAPLVDLIRQVERERDDGQLNSLESLSELAISGAGRVGDVYRLSLQRIGELGADGPVLVGFDDLDWADAATWDLFEHVARNLVDERVVLVGAFRADEVAREPGMRRRVAELSRVSGVERVVLAGLERNAVAMHAAAVLGIPPPPSLVDELVRRGEGNPFFTEELVAAPAAHVRDDLAGRLRRRRRPPRLDQARRIRCGRRSSLRPTHPPLPRRTRPEVRERH